MDDAEIWERLCNPDVSDEEKDRLWEQIARAVEDFPMHSTPAPIMAQGDEESCPRCGGKLRQIPEDCGACSRRDGRTTVCADCGLDEALCQAQMAKSPRPLLESWQEPNWHLVAEGWKQFKKLKRKRSGPIKPLRRLRRR